MGKRSEILVLGGPAAGKTVFLSVLYSRLWRGHNGTVLRAANGVIHSELSNTADLLATGQVPAATAALRHLEFELEHGGATYFLHSLDYPGELFRRVFYETIVDTPEAQSLHGACQAADGILLLLDPKGAAEQGAEHDFAVSNLIRFCNARPNPPSFVLALTKRDTTKALVRDNATIFLRQHMPNTCRLLDRGIRVIHFCSIVQSPVSITLASPDAVVAPLEALLSAVERRQWLETKGTQERRAAFTRATNIGVWVSIMFVSMLVAFFTGLVCRHFVEQSR